MASKIDDLYIQIHFNENSIPGIRAGKMTDESKQALLQAILEVQPPTYPICENNPTSVSTYCNKCWDCKHRNEDDLWTGIENGVDQYSAAIKELFGGSDE